MLSLLTDKEESKMEKDSMVFLRGQVWYWKDPLYGSKEENGNSGVLKLDPSLRFSRYVIILQDMQIPSYSISVIPCSTSTTSVFDVPVHLPTCPPGTSSFARTASIFPAHIQSLENYVCTLTTKTMNRIEEMVLKLLIPNMYREIPIPSKTVKTNNVVLFESKTKTSNKPTINWNEKNILKFITMYQSKGIEVVRKEFNLSESTAKNYYYNFRKKLYPNSKVKAMPNMYALEGFEK